MGSMFSGLTTPTSRTEKDLKTPLKPKKMKRLRRNTSKRVSYSRIPARRKKGPHFYVSKK